MLSARSYLLVRGVVEGRADDAITNASRVVEFVGVAVWLHLFHRTQYSLYRNAFLISGAIGIVCFWAFPTAPPRLLQQWGFVDTAPEAVSYYIFQPPAFVNQYAAMPSLHFGWNVLVAAALFSNVSRPWRFFVLVLPAVTLAGSVLSANHFLVDAAAGAVVAVAGLWLAQQLRRRAPRRRPFSVLT